MARARNIKPGFFTNDILAECHPLARILFIGLWTIADREGRLEDRAKKIKAELLPYDNCDCDKLLNELCRYRFITRYESQGNKYIQILNFTKHQNPHIKESPSTIPAPDQNSLSTIQELPLTDSLNPLTKTTVLDIPSKDHAEDFWKKWPIERRKEKPNFLKAWRDAVKKSDHEKILAGLERYLKTKEVKDGFAPYPAKWLKQERWTEDETIADKPQASPEARHKFLTWKKNRGDWMSDMEIAELKAFETKEVSHAGMELHA